MTTMASLFNDSHYITNLEGTPFMKSKSGQILSIILEVVAIITFSFNAVQIYLFCFESLPPSDWGLSSNTDIVRLSLYNMATIIIFNVCSAAFLALALRRKKMIGVLGIVAFLVFNIPFFMMSIDNAIFVIAWGVLACLGFLLVFLWLYKKIWLNTFLYLFLSLAAVGSLVFMLTAKDHITYDSSNQQITIEVLSNSVMYIVQPFICLGLMLLLYEKRFCIKTKTIIGITAALLMIAYNLAASYFVYDVILSKTSINLILFFLLYGLLLLHNTVKTEPHETVKCKE